MKSEVVEVLLPDAETTFQLGEVVGRNLQAGVTVALIGDLGVGKTCFVRGLARGLDVDDPDAVSSPTYLLVVEHHGPIPLLHMDAYLPDKLRAFLLDGGVDYLAQHSGVVAIEWADQVLDLLPEGRLTVHFDPATDTAAGRRVRMTGALDRYRWLEGFPPGSSPGKIRSDPSTSL